ncbi:MAG: magnesium transporter CorA family protein [Actinomycetota bacterium]|nr:magnesium transporter CorA family protein [Actinomycetota bacterium]
MLLAICHSDETGWSEVTDLSNISDLREQGELVWAEADVKNLGDEDVATIAEEFSLRPDAVEDARTLRQRPRLEMFDDHIFMVLHQLDDEDGQLEPTQIAMFVGDHYVLVIHWGASRTLEEARGRWHDLTAEQAGSAWLLYTILDTVVDEYQRLAEDLEQEIEDLEELTLESLDMPVHSRMTLVNDSGTQRRIYSVKQRISRLRRYGHPAIRLIENVLDDERNAFLDDRLTPMFTDVKGHALRIDDQVSDVENLTNAILDLRRAEQAGALNEVTKKLTAWAAIIAVPTLISSVYGMNFHLFPTDREIPGFWFALGLMLVLGVGLYLFFKRRNWL